jgi:hypothetical protein
MNPIQSGEMTELTEAELDQVRGGVAPFVAGLIVGGVFLPEFSWA